VRSAIEQVFGRQKTAMGLFVRTIGIIRARAKIGMANLAYNFTRYGTKGAVRPPRLMGMLLSMLQSVSLTPAAIAGETPFEVLCCFT
jgi:hypothetical protein